MRCRSRLGSVRSSMVLRKRRNSRCWWRGMHWPMTVPSSMLRAANRVVVPLPFSSGGFGTPAHLAGEMFKLQTGVRAVHVPYQALPRAIADLLNGTNHYQFITPLPVIDLINAGKLRAIAVTGPARLP